MKKNITFLLAAGLIVLPIAAKSEDKSGEPVLELMATSKIAGACGVLNSLIDFQSGTKMSGGDEFVARFWAVEAARLGHSVEELSVWCSKAITTYDTYWKALDKPIP
jgi:hypothetical protein